MSETSTNNPWFGVSMALVGVIVGYGVAMSNGMISAPAPAAAPAAAPTPTAAAQPTPQAAPTPSVDNVPEITDADHIRGNPNAAITIIEYSDFECPFCTRHHPTMAQVIEEYPDDVNWVYRHYPLGFHPNAKPSAEAAECAGELGGNDQFWAFSDLIFESGADATKLEGYAAQLGLDATKFKECMDSGRYGQLVDDQLAQGTAAGVRGTPGTFVYDNKTKKAQYVSGAQPFSAFKTIIDAMLGS